MVVEEVFISQCGGSQAVCTMVKASSSLLALIHQHLLQNGYCKAARELQIESGEKFSSPKVCLRNIYKDWNNMQRRMRRQIMHLSVSLKRKWAPDFAVKRGKKKKAKKRKASKQNDAQSKKQRVQDPATSSESSDDEENALQKGAAHLVQLQGKQGSKAAQVKPVRAKPKKMTSVKETPAKVKITPKTATPSLNDKPAALGTTAAAVFAESSDSSESEEETIPLKATPVQATTLKPAPEARETSEGSSTSESEAETGKQDKTVPAKITPTATKKSPSKATSNGKAMVKNEVSESSDSSDDTDIDKPQKVPTPVIAAPQVKVATSSTKTITPSQVKAAKGKRLIKATDVSTASQPSRTAGKSPTPLAKTVAGESSDSSDSEEEVVASTPKLSVPSSIQASKEKANLPPAAPQPEAESSSGSSDSESEEEPVKQKTPQARIAASQVKVDTPVTKTLTASEAKAAKGASGSALKATASQSSSSLGKTQTPTKAGVYESSDSLDSEEEQKNQKVAALVHASAKKVATPASQTKAVKPGTTAVASIPAASEDSGSSDSSDSDSGVQVSQKIATPLSTPTIKTSSMGTKHSVTTSLLATGSAGKAKTPPQASQPAGDSSESDKEPGIKTISAAPVKNSVPSTPKLAIKPSADSDADSESSDSEEKPGVKVKAVHAGQIKTAPKVAALVGKAVPGKGAAASKPPPAESSETTDSEEEEPQPLVTAPNVVTPTVAAKGKTPIQASLQPDESSSEDSESYSDDEPVKTLAEAKAAESPKTKLSAVASLSKTPAKPAASPVVAKDKTAASGKVTAAPKPTADSSETSDSSADEDLPQAQILNTSLKAAPPAAKSAGQSGTAVKGKIGSPAKTVAKAAAAEESSGSSDSSDSEEEQAGSQKIQLPTATKQNMATPNPLTSTPSDTNPAKGKAAQPSKTLGKLAPAEVSESSDTDSDEEGTAQVGSPAPSTVQTAKDKKVTGKLAKPPTPSNVGTVKAKTPVALKRVPVESSSESSDSESSDMPAAKVTKPTPAIVKTMQTKVSDKFVKTPVLPSPTVAKIQTKSQLRTPVALQQTVPESSSESSSSEEEPEVKKVPTPAPPAVKPTQRKQANKLVKTTGSSLLAAPKTKHTGPAKTPLGLKQAAAESSSESSDSEEESAVKLALSTPKPAALPSVVKGKAAAPPMNKESSSEDSDSDDEEEPVKPAKMALASVGAKQGKLQSAAKPTKVKAPSLAKVSVSKPPAEKSSDTASSDSEEDVPLQTPALPLKVPLKKVSGKAGKTTASTLQKKAASPVPAVPESKAKDSDSSDTDDAPELQVPPPTKPTSKKKKSVSEVEDKLDVGKAKKRKTGSKHTEKPDDAAPIPTPLAALELLPPASLGAMLESEEETVLALLEGRSPKKSKTKRKSSKKNIAETPVVEAATLTVQGSNNVPVKSPSPLNPSLWVPESPSSDEGAKNLNVKLPSAQDSTPLPGEKVKSGKKRKISTEDGLAKQEEKLAKKEKKEKKQKLSGLEGEVVTPKPKSSKKDKKKSEKDKTKKKKDSKNKKKEGKKLTHSISAPVGESTDSGISLLSKPKKKKKIKADKKIV